MRRSLPMATVWGGASQAGSRRVLSSASSELPRLASSPVQFATRGSRAGSTRSPAPAARRSDTSTAMRWGRSALAGPDSLAVGELRGSLEAPHGLPLDPGSAPEALKRCDLPLEDTPHREGAQQRVHLLVRLGVRSPSGRPPATIFLLDSSAVSASKLGMTIFSSTPTVSSGDAKPGPSDPVTRYLMRTPFRECGRVMAAPAGAAARRLRRASGRYDVRGSLRGSPRRALLSTTAGPTARVGRAACPPTRSDHSAPIEPRQADARRM